MFSFQRRFVVVLALALSPRVLCGWTGDDLPNRRTFSSATTQTKRGGAQPKKVSERHKVFTVLAHAVLQLDQLRKGDEATKDNKLPEISDLVQAFKRLCDAQNTFKGLDGAAHEAYQRTHNTDSVKMDVSGRAARTAARTSAVASALEACEWSELAILSSSSGEGVDLGLDDNTTEASPLFLREILLNESIPLDTERSLSMNILVMYEPSYHGGAGTRYGDIQEMINITTSRNNRIQGRLLVALGVPEDSMDARMFSVLAKAPRHVPLSQGMVAGEAASVQPVLHEASSRLLERIEPILRRHNTSAIHFVGHSLAGGVACLSAAILDGKLPLKGSSKKKEKLKPLEVVTREPSLANETTNKTDASLLNQTETLLPLQGLGRSRTSAVALGGPPSISSNVQTDFIVSILHGDDIMGRTSSDSLERFFQRTRKALKTGLFGGQLNKMTDTISLATSNIKNYAHGSEGEEARLSVPGRAYLLRPRRLGGVCSIHEIGSQLKGGREAIRSSVLWQLNDIVLSKSLWKHHQLDSYIQALDRAHIRGVDENEETDTP